MHTVTTLGMDRILYYSSGFGAHDEKFIRVLLSLSENVFILARRYCSLSEEFVGKVQFTTLAESYDEVLSGRQAVVKLKAVLKSYKPEVTVAGPLWPCAYEASLAKALKLVGVSWAFDVLIDAKRSARTKKAISVALSHAKLLLFDSPWIFEEAQKISPIEKYNAKIFPWGVDTDRFSPAVGTEYVQSRPFTILHTRRLDHIYRPDVVVKAFMIAVRMDSSLQLRMVASGPLLSKLVKFVKHSGVSSNFEWVPPFENRDLPAILRNTSLYTTAARSDGVSISLLEAMATGVPVVVPNLPSNVHVLGRKACLQTFELNDAKSMADRWLAISRLPTASVDKLRLSNRAMVEKNACLKAFERNYSLAILSLFAGK